MLWFTGLSGSGKSTIANLLEKKLHAAGRHTYILDGDNVRHGLNRDLGFTDEDRVENIRRVAEVAQADGRRRPDRHRLLHLALPRRAADGARPVPTGEFIEVFVDTPFEECARRDPKGLYARATGRRDQELHRRRFALRGAGKAGNPSATRSARRPKTMVDVLETWLIERDRDEQQYDDGGGI